MIRLEMKNSNGEAAKILALSSGKIDKYLKSEEILLPDQRRVIEQAQFMKDKQKRLKTNEKNK